MKAQVKADTNAFFESLNLDVEASVEVLHNARKEGKKTIDIAPKCICPDQTITTLLEEINPGERINIILPSYFTHFPDGNVDFDAIDGLKYEFAGPSLRDGIFLNVRHDDNFTKVIVDIYRV